MVPVVNGWIKWDGWLDGSNDPLEDGQTDGSEDCLLYSEPNGCAVLLSALDGRFDGLLDSQLLGRSNV